ncbi:hypothetical protein E4U21_006564 [Claviceps maximensis]|nr:hypothetical protein E4U21_006564 [Claviceps maximensis]
METLQTDAPPATAPPSTTVRLPPLSEKGSSDGDSTWQAPGVETWGSSTDDDDDDDDEDDEDADSVVEVVKKKPPTTKRAPSQTTKTAQPRLSGYERIVLAEKQWLDEQAAAAKAKATISTASTTDLNGPNNPVPRSWAPVPLPPHPLEAYYNNKPGSTFKRLPGGGFEVSYNPNHAQLKQRLADSMAARLSSSTPVTPVPLPLSVRQKESSSASTSKLSVTSFDRSRSWSPANKNNPQPIIFASDKTPYALWTNADGEHMSTRGALIPAKYRLHDDPQYPFICPIRDCRRTLPSLFALGGHFNAAHKHAQVNDNLDGTFTQVGTYKNIVGHSPCVVISQKEAPPDAPPPVEPRLPDTAAKNREIQGKRPPYDQGGIRAKRQMTHADSTQATASRNNAGSWPCEKRSSDLLTLIAEGRLDQMDSSDPRLPKRATFPPHQPSSRQVLSSTTGTEPVASPALSSQGAPQDAPELTLAGPRSIRQSVLARLEADKNVSGPRSFTRSPSVQHEGAQYGQFSQSEQADYEMEDWEIAPGRVTSKDSSQTSTTPIVVCSDISFNVLTIRPGQIYRTTKQRDKMQMYSLASGKVQVTTGGQTVQLGPNGAFPLRPGERCIIENKLYTEATLHCTTVNDYEMSSKPS